MQEKITLAPAGSSAIVTTSSMQMLPYDQIAFIFTVDTVGGTPTVTWKIQGSVYLPQDGDTVPQWNDVAYVTPISDTLATTAITRTALGSDTIWLDNAIARKYVKFRLAVTALTNVTFHCDAIRIK